MKILLTHAYYLDEDPKERVIRKPYAPLGILYISAFLEQEGYINEVSDSTFISSEKHRADILAFQPDLLAIYVNLMTKINVLALIRFVRSEPALKNTRILLGGPEVRSHAQNFLEYGADFIISGEGEVASLRLAKALEGKDDIAAIPGLHYRKEGIYTFNGEQQKIRELDELPEPARHRINLAEYMNTWKNAHGKSAISISTMRGCPYTCKWCSRAVYGLSYRRRSAAKVVDEMLSIRQNHNPDTLWFVDDVFTISHKWMQEFADEVKRREAIIPYECISRADRLNEKVFENLKESGCYKIWIGAESGSQEVIDKMDRRVSVENTREMIQMAKRYGLEAGTFIMLGYPGEMETDIIETARHLKISDPDHFTITLTYPIAGTELHDEVKQQMTIEPEWSKGTDRDKDFKRTYRRSYYNYAIRFVYNEVFANRALKEKKLFKGWYLKSKSILARKLMLLHRLRNQS